MQEKTKRTLLLWLRTFAICLVCTAVVFYFTRGVGLYGLPDVEDIRSVEVSDGQGGARTLTGGDDIELARNLAGTLRYRFGHAAGGDAAVTITYHLKDGSSATVSANGTTAFWNGRAYRLTDSGERFLKLARGVFFPDVAGG